LRIITRSDIPLTYQAVQSAHACVQFQYEHPELAKNWFNNSNYLIFLSVENEQELEKLISKANSNNINISIFREPDINNEITAIALEPCDWSRRHTSGIPLMRKEKVDV
tara:strand:- start:4907 stop:5233 length:327 start_codon:yes stop_codon:yes gene_type:complete